MGMTVSNKTPQNLVVNRIANYTFSVPAATKILRACLRPIALRYIGIMHYNAGRPSPYWAELFNTHTNESYVTQVSATPLGICESSGFFYVASNADVKVYNTTGTVIKTYTMPAIDPSESISDVVVFNNRLIVCTTSGALGTLFYTCLLTGTLLALGTTIPAASFSSNYRFPFFVYKGNLYKGCSANNRIIRSTDGGTFTSQTTSLNAQAGVIYDTGASSLMFLGNNANVGFQPLYTISINGLGNLVGTSGINLSADDANAWTKESIVLNGYYFSCVNGNGIICVLPNGSLFNIFNDGNFNDNFAITHDGYNAYFFIDNRLYRIGN